MSAYILTHLGYNFYLYITGVRDQCLKRNYYKMKRCCCGSPKTERPKKVKKVRVKVDEDKEEEEEEAEIEESEKKLKG